MVFQLHRLLVYIVCVIAILKNVSSFTTYPSISGSRCASECQGSSPNHLMKRNVKATFLASAPATIPKIDKKVSKNKDKKKEKTPSKSKGWAVRLYNDPMNKREFVARCLTEVCSLSDGAAYQCMMQAHQFGIAVVGQYHLEMAELYRDQLREHGLMTDMVPVDDDK